VWNLSGKESRTDVSIVETEKVAFQDPLAILGFAGPGLVGGIAVTHVIDQLKMKEVAHVQSRFLPPAVVFMNGRLRHPFRIYSDQKGTLCAVVCEIPLYSEGLYPITSALLDWAEQKGVKELVILEGIALQNMPRERTTFCATEPEKLRECEKKGVAMHSAGIIYGIAGSILNECLTRKITGVVFLTPVAAFLPDIEGAAELVRTLDKAYGLKIDTKALTDSAEEIKEKLKEVAERHQKMRKAEERSGVPESIYV
jgi:uncharacterized protein